MIEGMLGWDCACIPHVRCAGPRTFQGFGEWSHFLMSSRRVLAFHAFHEKGEREGDK